MRGFFVLLLAIAAAVVVFVATRNGGDRSDVDGGPTADTFSRTNPGDHGAEVVRALEPRMVLVRGANVWHGRVEVRPPTGVKARRLEVAGPSGALVVGIDVVRGTEAELRFTLPLDASGAFVARALYDTGEVWSFSTEL